MDAVETSILQHELEPLNAQIGQAEEKLARLEEERRAAEAELEDFSADRQRFDALREVCAALDKLEELGSGELFWEDAPRLAEAEGHRQRLRERIENFESQIRESLEKEQAVKTRIDGVLDELDDLDEEVRQAHAREERRLEEFSVEREMDPHPARKAIMPWTGDGESEGRFRRVLLVSFLVSIVFGSLVPLVDLPIPDRNEVVVEIPERLAMLVKKEPPVPEPVSLPEPAAEPEKKPEKEGQVPEPKKAEETKKAGPKPKRPGREKSEPAPAVAGAKAARKKAESTGVLAFKNSFSDLMDETPVAKLGVEARLDKDASLAAGQARPQRSLVAIQAKGASGGIGNARISRNLGYGGTGEGGGGGNAGRIGGVGIARVESAVAGLAEGGRPLSDGPGPARTDEEIQIVFDRYKATLYRIYNKELRKDPTLRGKLLLRLTIEPGGEVSACGVESTDLASPELVDRIVARVERFNFGPKEEVPRITILYPIDFLPAG